MNPELYKRYMQKKAKKLGISVEELEKGNCEHNRTDNTTFDNSKNLSNPAVDTTTAAISGFLSPNKISEEHKISATDTLDIKDNRDNKFGLIGYPLGHSMSKIIHEAGFKSLGISAEYNILETPPDNLVDRLKFLKSNGYKGFNVTIPLKLPISLFVNEVDKYADISRAINTVYINPDKTLRAYNTDIIGFKRAIPHDIKIRCKHAGILGTGGAAHAACIALIECGVNKIDFFTRNIPNAIGFMHYLREKFNNITFNVYQIEHIRNLNEYDMLVNATPIGMLGRAAEMMPVEISTLKTLKSDAVVYDVIYNPKRTKLINEAQKLGLSTITGLDMLIYQAIAAQEIWFGNTPDFKDMKIAALESM